MKKILGLVFAILLALPCISAVTISTTNFDYVQPGKTYTKTITYGADASDNTYELSISGISSWVTITPNSSFLPGRTTAKANLTLTLPKDAAPGDYSGYVVISSVSAFGSAPQIRGLVRFIVTNDRKLLASSQSQPDNTILSKTVPQLKTDFISLLVMLLVVFVLVFLVFFFVKKGSLKKMSESIIAGQKEAEKDLAREQSVSQLATYIRRARLQGYKIDVLEKALIEKGWPKDIVKEAMEKAA